MARFVEAFRCEGVDELAHPPTMVVRLLFRTNLVVLEDGPGLPVHSDNKHITIEEIRDHTDIFQGLLDRQAQLAKPGVDPQQKLVLTPDIPHSHPRYFRIGSKTIVNPPGALVYAGSGPNKATLRVVVLAPKNVRLSIRNVTVPESGKVVFHARKPCDPEEEVDGMNDVWGPQTNILFDLVSSRPIFLDDRETAMREKLAKAFEMRAKEASFPPETVSPHRLKNIFKELNDRDGDKADFTVFVVDRLTSEAGQPAGVTAPELGIAFIAGSHYPSTFAHEAGHFLARGLHGKFMFASDGHTGEDVKLLMRRGGSSWKIPFDQAIVFRENLGKIIG